MHGSVLQMNRNRLLSYWQSDTFIRKTALLGFSITMSALN